MISDDSCVKVTSHLPLPGSVLGCFWPSLCEVPEYTDFAIWPLPGLPPKVAFSVMFQRPQIDAKSTSKLRVQNMDFGARGAFGTAARKPTLSGLGPGPWRCENTTPAVRYACQGARTRYIRQLPQDIVLDTFSMKSQRGQDPLNQVRFVTHFSQRIYSEMACLP